MKSAGRSDHHAGRDPRNPFGADSKTEALIVSMKVRSLAMPCSSQLFNWLGRNGIYMEDLYVPGLSR